MFSPKNQLICINVYEEVRRDLFMYFQLIISLKQAQS